MSSPTHRVGRRAVVLGATLLGAGAVCGCSAVTSLFEDEEGSAVTAAAAADSIWDASVIHVVQLELDEDEFRDMVAAYQQTGEKEWLTAEVAIDGETFRDAGVRLKGNSSLRGVDSDTDPVDLPWLIDLDKVVDGQSLDGSEGFVVRSNNSETALNEAVALDLLREAGLVSQDAVETRFSVNGGEARLRLLVQDLDERWFEATFGGEGTLYKSEAGGDWSYRGEDPAAYDDVFDIEAGTDDYAPLTEFLRWLNESSDDDFASGLADRLDVDAFATYLALEDLIGNSDDIEGPGNNSYLRWDPGGSRMTVIAWDHNLAFGGMDGMGGRGGGWDDGGWDDGGSGGGFGHGGGPGRSNVLAERFREQAGFATRYDDAVARLRAELFEDGTADGVLDTWTALLRDQATDLVDQDTIDQEAERVASYLDGHAAGSGA